ncbi:cupin [Gordonia spumicola]|uniref:Cupin n=1 Tax=Gordonia spumicola TaxID=589161 RepID=A0A7I9V7K8_9ACTN|nr:cupin domain-containing protein [Gordonia spumicola]GEE01192.1 cupin [Gordonia spumicola]
MPHKLTNTTDLTRDAVDANAVAWKLEEVPRGLDSNVIRLPAGGSIGEHVGGEVDVLVHVIAGSGRIGSGDIDMPVTAGDLLWLPRQSHRSITAGDDGLDYLTVHTHREPTLTIGMP